MHQANTFLFVALFALAAAGHSADADPFLTVAKTIERAAQANDAKTINKLIDIDILCERIKGDKQLDAGFVTGFKQGFKESAGSIGQQFCQGAEQGSFDYLNMKADGSYRIGTYRMTGPTGVNYHELLMQKQADGSVRVIDVRAQNTGEYISELIQPIFLSAVQNANPGLFKKLFGGKPTIIDVMPKMEGMKNAVLREDYVGAIRIYDTIPAELRTWKPLHLLRIAAYAKIDEKSWLAAIEDFEKAYPGDAAVKLQMIDAHLLRNDYASSLLAVDGLDKSIGGDPYLNVLRANIYAQWGKPAEGIALAQKAVGALKPPRDDAYTALLYCQAKAKKYPEAVKTLSQIEEVFGLNEEYIQTEPEYADLRASAEYKAWVAGRKK